MCANVLIKSFLQPAGLKNKGNTCFFNATTQCLLSIPSFISYFKRGDFCSKKQPLSFALKEFIYDYQNYKVCDPHDFIKVLRPKIKLFDGRQQDAHCFLEIFLNTLIEEQGAQDTRLKNMFRIDNEDLITCRVCRYSNTVRTSTIIQYLFMEESVRESLHGYMTKDDTIESSDPWVCPECKGKNGLRIRHKIIETSEYVIVHLNRFQDMYRKNERQINIDEELRINDNVYENVGVVCHSGTLSGGHYFSKGRRDKIWYEFNDSCITKTTRVFDSNEPYILFYTIKK